MGPIMINFEARKVMNRYMDIIEMLPKKDAADFRKEVRSLYDKKITSDGIQVVFDTFTITSHDLDEILEGLKQESLCVC